jgi:DNA-binding MarR family transcriptional regulator
MNRRSDEERLYLFVQHVGRRLRDIDVAHGISPARFSALVHLAFHGVDNVGQLAAHERVSRPSMTRLVRDMEEDGLVRRTVDANDARGVLVALTKKGRDVVDQVRRAKIALIAEQIRALKGSERAALRLTLEALQGLEGK